MNSIENMTMGATFTLRNIEFLDSQIMLTNGNMVSDAGVESSRFATIRSQAFNFSFNILTTGFEIQNSPLDTHITRNSSIGRALSLATSENT